HAVITSADDVGRTNAGPGVEGSQSGPEWAVVTGMTVHPLGGVLTGAGAVTLLVAGAFGMIRPARRVRQDARFVTPAARREAARAGTAAGGGGPEPGAAPSDGAPEGPARDLWQELDAGRDPTEGGRCGGRRLGTAGLGLSGRSRAHCPPGPAEGGRGGHGAGRRSRRGRGGRRGPRGGHGSGCGQTGGPGRV